MSMKTFSKHALKLSALLLVLFLPAIGQKTVPTMDAPIPKFEIVSNKVNQRAAVRSIDVFVDEKDFNLNSISRIIQAIGHQFCDPYTLGITIFSSREMLEWHIKGVSADIGHFPGTPEGRKAAAAYYAKIYPPRTGYLRAFYRRNYSFEYLSISPSADSLEIKRIVIDDPSGGIKASEYASFPKSACKGSVQ